MRCFLNTHEHFARLCGEIARADLKLDSSNRYIVHFSPQAAGYTTPQVEALYRTIEDRFHALPGIVNVGISNYTPMEDNNWSNGIQIQGNTGSLKADKRLDPLRGDPRFEQLLAKFMGQGAGER